MADLRNRIYIGKLHYDVREKDIERFFKDFGKINDVNMKNGYAFVDFDDHRDADDAVYEMDGKDLLGDRVSVEHCKGGRDRRDDRRGGGGGYSGYGGYGGGRGGDRGGSSRFKNSFSLFERPFNTKHRVIVEGLSSSTDWRDLKDFFRRVAEVTFADAHRFRTGEGVADFRSKEDLRRVIRELDDTKLNGRRVRLIEEKQSSRSRSKSRSPRRSVRRSRSRSRSADRSRGSRPRDDKRSPTPEKRARSPDNRSRSRDRRSRSPEDRRSRSNDRRSRSKERRSRTPDKRSKSAERRSKSPEKRSRSKSPKQDERSGDLKESDAFERSKSRSPEKERSMEADDTVSNDQD